MTASPHLGLTLGLFPYPAFPLRGLYAVRLCARPSLRLACSEPLRFALLSRLTWGQNGPETNVVERVDRVVPAANRRAG